MPHRNYMLTILERILEKTVVQDDGCIVFTGARSSDGYGQVRISAGRTRHAHRLVYEAQVGLVPQGKQLDHLCRNRLCVNFEHLEPVTLKENVLRGNGLSAQNARKTHCKRNHAFTAENTRLYRGQRVCRTCQRETMRMRRARPTQTVVKLS